MILVLASVFDEAAGRFVTELTRDIPAALVSCGTLASQPLCLHHPDFTRSSLTVDGRKLFVDEIRGVVNLLPVVQPDEILFYDDDEREYQAAEIHALLTFFLASLACPVVNRPTAASLSGPFQTPLGWHSLASGARIPVVPLDLRSEAFVSPFRTEPAGGGCELEVLGDRILSPSGTAADEYTVELARRGRVEYLKATYRQGPRLELRFLSAHTIPNVRSRATCAALKRYLSGAKT